MDRNGLRSLAGLLLYVGLLIKVVGAGRGPGVDVRDVVQEHPPHTGEAMQPFTKLTGIAAPLPVANVDTDKIIPARHLKTIKRTGLGVHLFETLRYHDDGSEREDFVLNREPYRKAEILIGGENFGCGSSREHAPWALLDFGIRCVIAPSFADIFYNNCFKNGFLPVPLTESEVDQLFYDAASFTGFRLVVDLDEQTVATSDGSKIFRFDVDPFRKYCLLNGLDEIGLTLRHAEKIKVFEARRKTQFPWYF